MCTSMALTDRTLFFGRNMDLEYQFGERVVVVPGMFPIEFRAAGRMDRHFAIIGMAAVADGYPLFADAANEKGLCIAGLNFPDNAYYADDLSADRENIAPFELPLRLLGECASVREARALLEKMHLVKIRFSEKIGLSPLHWHIADREESIVVEPMRDGLHVHDNPVGVMTNNPPFEFHLTNLRQYLNLTAEYPVSRFHEELSLAPFGVGLGGMGLPGDFSPASRFVKAVFLKYNSVPAGTAPGSVTRFMHLLDAVAMPDGAVKTAEGKNERTSYSCCIDAERGVYYYKTYENSRLTAVDMRRIDPEADKLYEYPLCREPQIMQAN